MKSGGISARTKSLRDKFKQKRSFSELSFQAPSTSTSSLATSDVSSRPGSLRRPRSHAPNLFDQVSHEKSVRKEYRKILDEKKSQMKGWEVWYKHKISFFFFLFLDTNIKFLFSSFCPPRIDMQEVRTQSAGEFGVFQEEILIPMIPMMPIVQPLILIVKVMNHVSRGKEMLQPSVTSWTVMLL